MATKGKKSTNLPAVPAGVDKQTRDFLTALKETVETMQGKRRNSFMDSVVTFRDLQSMGLKVSNKVGTEADYDFTRFLRSDNPPNPPRNLVVEQQIFANKLTWENPSDKDLSHIEVWCSVGSDSLSDSERIAVVTKPVAEYTHSGLNTRTSHYYWIRSFNWAGKYSVWAPKQGGYLVEASLDTAREESLHVLQNSITEGQLYGDLNSRIDLVDGPESLPGSVNARVKTEETARTDADGALAAQVQIVQANVDDNTAAIQTEATARADADGALAAEYYIKTDVNGYIAGFGVANDGATSEAVFLVDKFAVITPGQTPKVPFVIAPLDGVPTVGIDGNMIVDGSISARTLDAEIITGAFLAASAQIQLGLNGLLRMQEGAKLFAGAGNLLLDTSGNKTRLMIGQDGALDVDGNVAAEMDYMVLFGGDIQFYRWLDNDHRMYKALKRWETGWANNGEWVEIPGYWLAPPKIQLSPRNLTCYDHASPTVNQALNTNVTEIDLIEGYNNRYKFKANARLVIAAGSSDFNVGLSDLVTTDDDFARTSAYTTPNYCTAASIKCYVRSKKPTEIINTYHKRNVLIEIYVDNEKKSEQLVEIGETLGPKEVITFISGLNSGIHKIYLKATASDSEGTFVTADGLKYDERTISGYTEYTDPEAHASASANSYPSGSDSDSDYDRFPVPYPSAGDGWERVKAFYTFTYSKRTTATDLASASAGFSLRGGLSDGQNIVDTVEITPPVSSAKVSASASASAHKPEEYGSAYASIQVHSISVSMTVRKPKASNDMAETEIIFDSATLTLTGANPLAEGTVNYIAIGE
ncbi:phage tail tip fiber protein [Maridesulfovibrio bastinii]|uniref:phage tail tip fiber protein n=2 Tax=Maridesulfovibrio bastinii TaxID=47157 RepID=UPI0004175A61|nr:DUF1983 domain-containing protein [Maridesulfovibrio bastinii]